LGEGAGGVGGYGKELNFWAQRLNFLQGWWRAMYDTSVLMLLAIDAPAKASRFTNRPPTACRTVHVCHWEASTRIALLAESGSSICSGPLCRGANGVKTNASLEDQRTWAKTEGLPFETTPKNPERMTHDQTHSSPMLLDLGPACDFVLLHVIMVVVADGFLHECVYPRASKQSQTRATSHQKPSQTHQTSVTYWCL